jgi:hypothetical protein
VIVVEEKRRENERRIEQKVKPCDNLTKVGDKRHVQAAKIKRWGRISGIAEAWSRK